VSDVDEWGLDEPTVDEAPMLDPFDEPTLDEPAPTVDPGPGAMPAAGMHPALADALAARDAAEGRLDAARDALANAEGAGRVAVAKVEDFEQDETKAAWQLVAATEAVAKAERAIERRRAGVSKAERDLAEATVNVSAVLVALATEPEPADPEPFYGDVGEFVAAFLAPIWRHRVDADGRNSTWCRQWWRHPEAVARLDALWRAWEHLRLDAATGMSVWFRDHADHHMAILTSIDGPLGGCTLVQHKPKFPALPVEPPQPANMFAVDGQ
jgi:Domain of unknown function (DUF4913)